MNDRITGPTERQTLAQGPHDRGRRTVVAQRRVDPHDGPTPADGGSSPSPLSAPPHTALGAAEAPPVGRDIARAYTATLASVRNRTQALRVAVDEASRVPPPDRRTTLRGLHNGTRQITAMLNYALGVHKRHGRQAIVRMRRHKRA